MLDLEKLENKLDAALSSETDESLTNWLLSKRLNSYLQTMGKGIIENMTSFSSSDVVVESNSVSFKIEYFDIPCSQDYLIAA